METRAHYVLIGAFMLGGIILALLFTLWLASVERDYDQYEIVFTQKISGLAEGANVLFNGIPVGQVEQLTLDRADPNRSLALVRVEVGTPVKTDTAVELELVGVTGLAVVQFVGGSAETPMLLAVSEDRIPRIEANIAGIAAVLDSSGELVLNLQRLLSEENAAAVSRTIADVEAVTDVFADKESQIAQIIDNLAVMSFELRESAEGINRAVTRLDNTLATAQGLVDTEARTVLVELASAAAALDEVVGSMNLILGENREAISNFTQVGLGQGVTLLNKANRLVDQAQSILLEFDRDPTRFILGEGRPTAK